MNHPRPRLRVLVLAAAALIAAAAFAAVSGATTSATAPTNTGEPTVTGTAAQGQTLTTTSGNWSGDTPITFAYKWQRCDSHGNSCSLISGAANQTYTLAAADVGHTIRSQVTATNSAGSATASSSHTNVVTGASAPANTSLPTISGTAGVGATLTAGNGTWTGTAPITYTYQWLRCDSAGSGCTGISGETKTTYVVANADTGHTLRIVVTATNAGGQSQATSAATAAIAAGKPTNTVAPTVSGTTTQGQTLSVSNGTWVGTSPIAYTYLWERCDANGNACVIVTSANNQTFQLTAADVGHKIRCNVTATNNVGSNHVETAAVGPIASSTTLPAGGVKLPNGEISVPASSIPDSDRLTVTSVKYSPSAIHGKSPVSMTIKVIDQNKYVVSGVLVYVLPVPSNWASKAPETPTGQNGTVSVTVIPTIKAPKRGSLVLFVRARTPQGNLLAGSSTRRLVSVRIFGS